MSFHPYLFFGRNCREAFTRYQEVFGGELVLLTGADMPAEEQMPGAGDAIMHAALTIGDSLLMGSDDPTTASFGPVQGMMVNHTAADPADAERVFEALSEGGEVRMPMAATSWSPRFGMCVDRFGTPWMVNVEAPAEQR
ncbi:VOC family protein [soil metagenome]